METYQKSYTMLSMPFRKTRWRFLALALAALLLIGNNYSFDNPQALQTQLEEELNITISQFNLLYSVFSLPNIFLTVIGGMIIDKLGVRFGIFTFSLIVTLAQVLIAIAGATKTYPLMLVGRGIFGVASENLVISQSTFVSLWFKGKELATAMGIILTIPELGSALNSFLSPLFYENSQSLSVPLFASVGFCIFSFLCGVALLFLDKYADKKDSESQCIYDNIINFELTMIQTEDDEDSNDEEDKEELSFKDIKKLSGTFWILLLICTLCLSLYIPFLDNANQFCQQRFNYSPILAGRAIIITYLTPTILSPIIGQLVDRIGLRRRWILATTCLFILTHTLFAVIPTPKDGEPQFLGLIPLCLLGVSYTFYSCVAIPSVQYVVQQRIMGTAFGILCLMESVGQCVFPLVAAIIYESHDNYKQVALFYTGISVLSLFFGVSLYFVDKKGSEILDAKNPAELFEKKSNLSDSDEDDLELPDHNTTANSEVQQNSSEVREKKLSFKSNGQSEVPVFEVQRGI